MRQIIHALDDVGFWHRQHLEKKNSDVDYDGPTYIIEARVNGQYHFVARALERKVLLKAARALAGAAGLDLKPWDE